MAERLKFNELLNSFAGPQLRKDISAALYAGADDVRRRSRRLITEGSVGEGPNHVVSAPGEPPNNELGFLVESHETRLPEWNHAQVAVTAPYATSLEYGTSKMAARPFLGRATRESSEMMQERLTKAIQQAAKRAAATVGGK